MARILVIDDEENIRKTLREILEDDGHQALCAKDGRSGLATFVEECPDVVLLDIKLPDTDGLSVLDDIKKLKINCEIIMISGHGTIEFAVKAIKLGAYHFLQKPLAMIEVKQIVRHAAEEKQQRDELVSLRQSTDEKYAMIGGSVAIRKVRQEIEKVAPTNGRVLITGESGTGKELAAYAIHKNSKRSSSPFVKVNCAAIPHNLIESELFGHEKGAFTGAIASKKGKFELAHTGTLFLDEIGDMDQGTQTRVLRAIQEGEFERVGGTKTITVDVRIVAATHRDLPEMIADGRFRQDLYYRLSVVPLHMPALAERADDIPPLAEHFLAQYCRENGAPPQKLNRDALGILMTQNYPGNIRELRNLVERLAIMSGNSEITATSLRTLMEIKPETINGIFVKPMLLVKAKDELERAYVQTQLEQNSWDIPKTAELLGLHRTNLHRKIRQLGIEKNNAAILPATALRGRH